MLKALLLVLVAATLATAAVVDATRPFLSTDATGSSVQGFATDPLVSYDITDDLSHTVSLYPSILWFSLRYGGSGTCIVRLMDTVSKGTHTAMPVATGTSMNRVANKNAKLLNYSGCNKGSGVANNSYLEQMGL